MKSLKNILRKKLNETLESKADKLMDEIRDIEEAFGDDEYTRGIDKSFDPTDYKKVNLKDLLRNIDRDSLTPEEDELYDIDLDDELYGDDEDLDPYISGEEEDLTEEMMEGEMCECGSGMYEAECTECGEKYEGIYDVTGKFPKTQSFDYIEEEEYDLDDEEEDTTDDDIIDEYCNEDSPKFDSKRCEIHQKMVNEALYGKQKMLDKNKNNKIDAEDFKLLRKSKKQVEEKWEGEVDVEKTGEYADMTIDEINVAIKKLKKQNEKYQDEDKKVPAKNRQKMSELYFAKRAKQGWKGKGKAKVDESVEYRIVDNNGDQITLNEDELVDLIENIVNEQKVKGLKTIGKPKGLTTYEKAHKGSGKENEDYYKEVSKKMKDYLKDGSKGKYEMNPKIFPKGNGELAKMDKKAFELTDDLEDFNYEIAGLNLPTPDAIDYNEEWMEKLYKGSSMTGNAPGGNALESDTNKRFDKLRKKNTLKKLKDQSYKRVPQPVYNEKTGAEKGKGLNIKLENAEPKKIEKLNEEFDRMKQLLDYSRKTQ